MSTIHQLSDGHFSVSGSCGAISNELIPFTYESKPFKSITLPILDEIDQIISTIQKLHPTGAVSIIGSSACSILDQLLLEQPLHLRDLDLAVISYHIAERAEIREFSANFAKHIPDVEVVDYFENRPRTPPDLPLAQNNYYNAGYGYYLRRKSETLPIIDITHFHHEKDLEDLNGFTLQDKVRIMIQPGQSFNQFLEALWSKKFTELLEEGWIKEPPEAYLNWTLNNLQLTNWQCMEREVPSYIAMRFARSCAKRNIIEEALVQAEKRTKVREQWKDLSQYIASNPLPDLARQPRMLERCLRDKQAANELKILTHAGVFDVWLPYLKDALMWCSESDIERLLSGKETTDDKVHSLVETLPLSKRLHTVFFALGGDQNCAHSLAGVWKRLSNCYEELGKIDFTACKELIDLRLTDNKERFMRTTLRTIQSTSLDEKERLELFLGALVTNTDELSSLFPEASIATINQRMENFSKPRIGFFTGVFDPPTMMHLKVVSHAIEQKVLDKVIVGPVYLSRKCSRPCLPFPVRRQMTQEGFVQIPEVEVIGPEYEETMREGGINALRQKVAGLANSRFVHIAGADAWGRFLHLGNNFTNEIEKGTHFFVLPRKNIRLVDFPSNFAKQIVYYTPPEPIDITHFVSGSSETVSSSHDVRQIIRAGRSFDAFVPEKVASIIKQQELYLPAAQLRMPWRIVTPNAFENIFKAQISNFQRIEYELSGNESIPEVLIKSLQEKESPALVLTIGTEELVMGYQSKLSEKPIIISEKIMGTKEIDPIVFHALEKVIHSILGH